jgi:hypothetical protein
VTASQSQIPQPLSSRPVPPFTYANARCVARLLANTVLLTHDGYGHTSGPEQLNEAVREFCRAHSPR